MKKKMISIILVIFIITTGLLAGCGQKGSSQSSSSQSSDKANSEPVTINFTYWAGAGGESDAFDILVEKFQNENPNIKINKQGGAFKDFYTKLETRIAAGDAPDVTRIQYQQIGRYATSGTLMDLTKKLPDDYSKDFNQALWNAVTYKKSIYAIPHHTDTLAVFYNKTYFDKLGIKVPQKLEDAWTIDEFLSIAKRVKDETDAKYGLAINWTNSNGYRWLPFLYQKGGAVLSEDLTKVTIDSPEAIEAIKLVSTIFKEELAAPGTSVKGTENVNNLFATGVIGMLVTGNWMIPYYEKNMTNYEFGVTYMPKDKAMASDLGGNALAVLKKAKYPEQALKFIEFMARQDNMKEFVEKGMFLPARNSLSADKLTYSLRPELAKIFVEQATTIPSHMAKTISLPSMSKINKILADELELVSTQGKEPSEAAKSMKTEIEKALK
ncbi:MAG: transporter substrate-binding protein [Deferribacteraceae bacterium]|jgi:ABC-type glycerol-3-phosphate transport system substrate-binding protein|nr:transporter substrate-binding protein [Deferribacteraceae bacterium]